MLRKQLIQLLDKTQSEAEESSWLGVEIIGLQLASFVQFLLLIDIDFWFFFVSFRSYHVLLVKCIKRAVY